MGFSSEIEIIEVYKMIDKNTNSSGNSRNSQQQNEIPQWIQRRKNVITKNYWPY